MSGDREPQPVCIAHVTPLVPNSCAEQRSCDNATPQTRDDRVPSETLQQKKSIGEGERTRNCHHHVRLVLNKKDEPTDVRKRPCTEVKHQAKTTQTLAGGSATPILKS